MMTRNSIRFVALAACVLCACDSGTTNPQSFTVTPPTADIVVGESIQLTAVGAPGRVQWSSANSSIVSVVPETGFVTALARGASVVSAVAGSSVATASISVGAPPAIGLSRPTVDFDITDGDADPAFVVVDITNAGDRTVTGLALGPTEYGASQPTGWLQVQLTGDAAPATLIVRARREALGVGVYTANVPILSGNATNSPQQLVVTFRIVAPPSIVLSRTQVPMAGIPGATVDELVQVTNGGGRPLTGLATNIQYSPPAANWLETLLSSTTAPATLTLRARAQSLAVGSYDATVTVSTNLPGVTARVINVRFTVTPGPAISLSRTVVPFVAAFQGANPASQQVTVTNSGGGSLTGLGFGNIVYSAGATGWLTPQISGTTAPATITLNVVSNTLITGNYTATVPVTSPVANNSPVNLIVTLNVGPPANMAVQPGALNFATFARGTAPGVQAVAITNTGGGQIAGLSTVITYTAGQPTGWLAANFQGGNTTVPATMLVQPTNTNLNRGTYTANIEVRSSTAGIASRNVSVTYVVSSFNIDVRPIFSTGYAGFPGTACTGCHGATAPALSGDSTAVWNNLVGAGRVVPNFPNSGVLICKITGVGACVTATNMRLPNPQIGIIQTWISRGAPR